jgi:hypothetical protein
MEEIKVSKEKKERNEEGKFIFLNDFEERKESLAIVLS